MAYRNLPPAPEGLDLETPLVIVGECPEPPSERGWLYEVKQDGWRVIVFTDGHGGLRVQTKSGRDYTWQFKRPVAELAQGRHAMILDGEMVVPDENGLTRLHALHQVMKNGETERLRFCPFDLLHLDGRDIRQSSIEFRKATLASHFKRNQYPAISPVSHLAGMDGHKVWEIAKRMGIEGIVSKKMGTPYIGGTQVSRVWLKSICHPEEETAQ